MNVEVGTFVKEGDIIAEMDKIRDYEVQLDAFQKKKQWQLSVHNASKAVAENARKQFKRVEALYKEKAIPKNLMNTKLWQEYRQQQRQNLPILLSIRELFRKRDSCENQLKDTVLKAPYEGYISRKYFGAGTTAGAGMPVVAISSTGNNKVKSTSEEDVESKKYFGSTAYFQRKNL